MAGETDVERARREAAVWHARLQSRDIDTADLATFRQWRRSPRNRQAYAEMETVWNASHGLAADREILALRAAAEASRSPRQRIASAWWVGALTLVMLVAVVSIRPIWRLTRPSYATAIGETLSVRLDDGSRLRLNTDSKVRILFSGQTRLVELVRGEAFFDVSHDRARPFLVDTGGTQILAVGTAFDVRRDAHRVRVTLVSGRLAVRHEADGRETEKRMQAGDALDIGGADVNSLRRADITVATSWMQSRLILRETPLAEAIDEVNRYTKDHIVLDDPAQAAEPVNGTFATGNGSDFAVAVAAVLPLRIERRDNAIHLVPIHDAQPAGD